MTFFSVNPLQDIAAFLGSYRSREKVLRTLQYGSWMLSGLTETRHPRASRKLLTVTERVGQTRVVLRLLDDLPMLASTLANCRTGKNRGVLMTVTKLVEALSGQLYYPTEHLAWAADNRLVAMESGRLWTLGVVLWLLSLITTLIQAVAIAVRVSQELKEEEVGGTERRTRPQERDLMEAGSETGGPRKRVSFKDEEVGWRARHHALRRQQFVSLLTVVQSLADLMNAINWLPQGVLWSGKLSNAWVGFFGTISSLIGLYKLLPRKPGSSQKQP